jgi:DNA (cytosine-5)-methyltransferase 1
MRMSRAATDQTGQFYRAAEFFAGMGLVRAALEQESFKVVWANDIDRGKFELYRRNFPSGDFVLKDIENVRGWDIPDVEIATASFPCVDLSLAGGRAGLNGSRSGVFWQFTRAIEEMDLRRPPVVLLENVAGFASSRQGKDIEEAVSELNRLGYTCDRREMVPASEQGSGVHHRFPRPPLPREVLPVAVQAGMAAIGL